MTPLLRCQNLSKQFGVFYALYNLNLSIGPGRIIGLLGPNGSGKTTLIKLANGLLTPSSGELFVGEHKPGPETKKIVSYLPDRTYFDQWMRVRDCLSLFRDFYEDFDIAKANDMLVSLKIDQNSLFRSLSKGTKEKVQLVLVMSRKAQLYLLDEPIGGVDPATRDYILQTIIRNYNEAGTVIISTHLIRDIEKILHDVIFLMNGGIERFVSVEALWEYEKKSVDEVFREVFRC
jgi:ABC-2 type transport system ATP-binding protein